MNGLDVLAGQSTTTLAVGDRLGKVVLQFPHPVRECVIDPATAHQVAEHLARSAYTAHYGVPPQSAASQISLAKRTHMKARATLIIRSLRERGKSDAYIADHVTDMLLKEV